MVGLSVMPHQEPRFLVPMIIPLILVYTWNRARLYRSFWVRISLRLNECETTVINTLVDTVATV